MGNRSDGAEDTPVTMSEGAVRSVAIPFTDGHRRRALTVIAVSALCPFAAACGDAAAPDQERAATPHVRVVALGDSETSGNGDPTGVGWVGR